MDAAGEPQPALTVSRLLRKYTPDFVRRFSSQAPPQVQSTLARLELCRTAALNGHRYRCDTCNYECCVYNSCGDRHCPLCSGAKRADWLNSTTELLLEGVKYFQVVFTIPADLSSLALGNRRQIYDLLFQSAWKSLRDVIASEQQFEAAAAIVLHTWNQKLEAHAHVHALVPGGGPSLTGERRWITSCRPDVPQCDGRYLCSSEQLKGEFRTNFLAGLRRIHRRGELKLTGEWAFLQSDARFEEWLAPLEELTWVVSIEPPPGQHSRPEHVAKYLARYLTGGPISDRRLVKDHDGIVTFQARAGQVTGGNRETEAVRITGAEFVRRWCLHILPKGYTKTRRFGGYSNRQRHQYLADCRELLNIAESSRELSETRPEKQLPEDPEKETRPCCPNCRILMTQLDFQNRPGWGTIMPSPARPDWYQYDDG